MLMASCEVSFEPLVDSGLHYTIAGYLDTDSDRQVIRVVPIRSGIDRPGSYDEFPTVTMTNQETGAQTVWDDSTYALNDGSLALAYVSREQAAAGQTYEVQVSGSRGASTVTVAVPVAPGHPDSIRTIDFPGVNNFPITLADVRNVIALEVFYGFRGRGESAAKQSESESGIMSLVSRYVGEQRGRLVGSNWEFDLRILEDRGLIADIVPGEILLDCLVMRVATPSEGWQPPPGGVFDPEILVQPGLFSNVENGLGWLGAVSRTSYVWPVINLPENIIIPTELLPVDRDPDFCLSLARTAFNAN